MNEDNSYIIPTPLKLVLITIFLLILIGIIKSNQSNNNITQVKVKSFKRACLQQICTLENKIKGKYKSNIILTSEIKDLSIGDMINVNENCKRYKGTNICSYKYLE